MQSPGILLTAPGAALIDFQPLGKNGQTYGFGRKHLSALSCRRRSPCNHHGSSWRPSRRDDVGNRFEDRCRVNVSDGFAAKGSFRQLVRPSSDKSYPCRHLHETILWSCAAKQVVATPWDPVLHPVEGRGHNHSWWGRSWHESNCTYDMKWDEMNTINPLDTYLSTEFLPYRESEPSSQPIFQQQSRSAFGEGLQKIYISGFHFNNIVTVSVIRFWNVGWGTVLGKCFTLRSHWVENLLARWLHCILGRLSNYRSQVCKGGWAALSLVFGKILDLSCPDRPDLALPAFLTRV